MQALKPLPSPGKAQQLPGGGVSVLRKVGMTGFQYEAMMDKVGSHYVLPGALVAQCCACLTLSLWMSVRLSSSSQFTEPFSHLACLLRGTDSAVEMCFDNQKATVQEERAPSFAWFRL